MDTKPTEEAPSTSRPATEESYLTLFVVLIAVFTSVLVAAAFALWYKFCRTCRRLEQADEGREQDEPTPQRTSAARRSHRSTVDFLSVVPDPEGVVPEAEGHIYITMPPCVQGQASATVFFQRTYSVEEQDLAHTVEDFSNRSLEDDETSSVTIEELPIERAEGDVSVEVHPHPPGSPTNSDATIREVGSGSSESIPPPDYPGEGLQQQYYGSEEEQLPDKIESLGLAAEGKDGIDVPLTPYRVPSTDLYELEKSLDYWRKQHSSRTYGYYTRGDDDEPPSKVRYNDTGSLEEYQYRQLWNLRATLAKDEQFCTQKLSDSEETIASTVTTMTACKRSRSSIEISPGGIGLEGSDLNEAIIGISQEQLSRTTRRQMYISMAGARFKHSEEAESSYYHEGASFESTSGASDVHAEGQSHRLQQLRADSGYRSMENPSVSRQHSYTESGRIPAAAAALLPIHHLSETVLDNQGETQLRREELQGMFSHSQQSMSYEDQQYDSFDSEQLMSYCGLRSASYDDQKYFPYDIQNPFSHSVGYSKQQSVSYSNQKSASLSKQLSGSFDSQQLISCGSQQSLSHISSDMERSSKYKDTTEKVHEAVAIGASSVSYPHSQSSVNEPDEGVGGLQSPSSTGSNVDLAMSWDQSHIRNSRTASKKRREFIVGSSHHVLAHIVAESDYTPPLALQGQGATYARDYSVDEKSDALFREFSRYDPVRTRHSSSHRQQTMSQSSVDQSRKLPPPRGSDDDQLPQNLSVSSENDESKSNKQSEIPVITLDDDEDEE
ncbi:serine-rich adhesin for platelets-like isoform X2 [Periplaneta americana]|uniref:serine-rich adhesin for platelets-like isoform X2 n=1 Tax=Periplaneta americana TaxID=6978 RepID=UPI0037E943B5